MESLLRYLLRWPSLEYVVNHYSWSWPVAEFLHFVGLCLLIGIVGMFDLRLLGMAKDLPITPLRRLLPWGVVGFVLCVISGSLFVGGLGGNLIGAHPYDILLHDEYLQLKLLFIFLAGINLLIFYATGMSRAVDALGPGDDAPMPAKILAGTSLSLWIAVVLWGRFIAWGL